MRKLNNARREWEQRHCSNSPFRIDNYGSSSSIGMDSMEGSPMAVNRGCGTVIHASSSIISNSNQSKNADYYQQVPTRSSIGGKISETGQSKHGKVMSSSGDMIALNVA